MLFGVVVNGIVSFHDPKEDLFQVMLLASEFNYGSVAIFQDNS